MRSTPIAAIIVIASMVLSGCLTGENPSDKKGDTNPTGNLPLPKITGFTGTGLVRDLGNLTPALGTLFYTGSNAFEPTIGITKTGTMFMTAFGGGANIVRSTDEGATWQVVTAQLPTGTTNPPNSNDPYVYVDYDTGRVFTNDLQALICSWMNFSDDEGKTWTTNPIGCGLPPGVHDHQTIGTGKPRTVTTTGYPNVVYYCVNRVADSVCATSLNGGLTFGPLIPTFLGVEPSRGGDPTQLNGFCGGLHGHVKSAPDGTTYLPKGQCRVPMVAVTEDDGLSWKQYNINTTVGVTGHEVAVAIDSAGNVYALWQDTLGKMRLAASKNKGVTWGPAFDVSPPGVTATDFPAITAGDAGRVAFAFAGTNVTGGYKGQMAAAEWHAYIGVSVDALSDDPLFQVTATNPVNDPVTIGACGRSRCPGIGDFIDIAIDPKGRPWAAFSDGCTGGKGCARPTIGKGFAGTLVTGPTLRGELGPLPMLAGLAGNATTPA
jgi:hypothetical protein